MDCRTTSVHKFRTSLGFKQYDVILTKEQSVLTKIISSFEGEKMKTQFNGLSYRIDLYFHDYKLAREIDENGQSNRRIDYKDFDLFRVINIKQSTKKNFNKENFNEIISIRV